MRALISVLYLIFNHQKEVASLLLRGKFTFSHLCDVVDFLQIRKKLNSDEEHCVTLERLWREALLLWRSRRQGHPSAKLPKPQRPARPPQESYPQHHTRFRCIQVQSRLCGHCICGHLDYFRGSFRHAVQRPKQKNNHQKRIYP